MSQLNNADFLDAFAHDIYPTVNSLRDLSFVKRPILAKLEQNLRHHVGRTHGYPVFQQAAIAQGTTRAGVQEQNAQAGDLAGFVGKEFTLGYFPPGYKGGFVTSSFDMALTQGNGGVPDGAYMEMFGLKMRGSAKEFGQRMERYFIGIPGKSLGLSTPNDNSTQNAQGAVTNLAAGVGEAALQDRTKIGAYRLNMTLHFSTNQASTPASAALLGSGEDQKAYIIGINKETAVLTVSDSPGGSAGHAALHTAASTNAVYIWNYTDFQGSSGYTPNVLPPGFQDWVPGTAPGSSDSFFGVNRSQQSDLAGWRLPIVNGEQLDDTIIRGLEEAFTFYGADGTYEIGMSPRRWTQMTQIAAGRGYRLLDGETATTGYRYIEIVHGDMRAECLSVPSMSNDDLFFMKFDDDGWVVRAIGGGWPKIVNGDGLKVLRLSADDVFEFRTEAFFHWGTMDVGVQGRADISGVATS